VDWLAEKLPLLIAAFVVVVRIIQALAKSRAAGEQHRRQQGDETEEERRVREIQDRIRRAVAARREGRRPTTPAPPVLQPAPGEDNDPFHGEPEPAAVPAPDPAAVARALRNAELERQAQLAEKMRALTEMRELARARAEQAAAEMKPAGAIARRHRLDEIIRDPENLRRAILVREILGPPVGLR
jgi:hypothetical protein